MCYPCFLGLSFGCTSTHYTISIPQQMLSTATCAGCKENHFYSLPYSGKLKLAFTSPDAISTSPKNFLFLCYSKSSENITCPLGKLKTEFTSPLAKSTSPGLSDSTFFARCVWYFSCHQTVLHVHQFVSPKESFLIQRENVSNFLIIDVC